MLRVLLTVLILAAPVAAESPAELSARAYQVLNTHCIRCHKGPGSDGGSADFLDMKDLLGQPGKRKPLVVPGKPDESRLFQRMAVEEDMPPEAAAKALGRSPSKDEMEAVRAWIAAGAPAFTAGAVRRPFLSLESEMTAIRSVLDRANRDERRYLRFFTLTHLHNDKTIPDEKLKLIRAALFKALNSLSYKPAIVLPEPLNESNTVYMIDIRRLDWDRRNVWRTIAEAYPYGVLYTAAADPKLKRLAEDIEDLSGLQIASLRADWFVATALRPPLYHAILDIPKNARDLERRLEVDVARNFRDDKLARAGFAASGVSAQNRLVERHDSAFGYYWKSYDFKPESGKARLVRLPLGPENLFPRGQHPFAKQAFVHDGGEIIFSLPNKLQAYMLVDGKDNRIDAGPIDVVGDSKKTAGTAAIVNGISCFACHTAGTLDVKDFLRDGSSLFGPAEAKVKALYPEVKVMNALVLRDREEFLSALEKAIGPVLKVGADAKKPITEFAEPCGLVSLLYRSDYLDRARVASDLYLKDGDELLAKVGVRRLKELGLQALLKPDGRITRLEWEAVEGYSLMQEVAKELGGTPVGK